jgi:murein DD-endopeptidase MepM/ murein hydrolase activator NlpD
MKPHLALLLLACAILSGIASRAVADEKILFESLKLTDDSTAKNVRVKKVTPTHVTITYDGGGSSIRRQDLPAELKTLYPYDAKAAAEFTADQAKEQEQRNKEAKARADQANHELKASLIQKRREISDRITALEKDAKQLDREAGPLKAKAKGKGAKSPERKALDNERDQKEELLRRIGEENQHLDTVNKQLSALP